MAGYFEEALVEAEVVSDGVLPALLVVAVVREVLHDELVDLAQCHPFLGAAADRHHDQGVVGKRGLLVLLLFLCLLFLFRLPVFPFLFCSLWCVCGDRLWLFGVSDLRKKKRKTEGHGSCYHATD